MSVAVFSTTTSGVFADLADLQAAVVEQVGNADFVALMPRFVRQAEMYFNRKMRHRDQMVQGGITTVNGAATLPADYLEAIGLFTAIGDEYVALPVQEYKVQRNKIGFFTVDGSTLLASDASYDFDYYKKIPSIADAMTATNWVLDKHPNLYLYAVSFEVLKNQRDADGAEMMLALRNQEMMEACSQDADERYARARVRVAGNTP